MVDTKIVLLILIAGASAGFNSSQKTPAANSSQSPAANSEESFEFVRESDVPKMVLLGSTKSAKEKRLIQSETHQALEAQVTGLAKLLESERQKREELEAKMTGLAKLLESERQKREELEAKMTGLAKLLEEHKEDMSSHRRF